MKIYGMEKLSLVDYDGVVSATVFTGACNFKCPFCHNAALVLDYNTLPAMPEEEIFGYLKKRRGILEGVCITGGEPTLHPDLPEFCKKIKDLGYLVKLDTNGTNPAMIRKLYEGGLADYFAMDIKNDRAHYSAITGLNNYDPVPVAESADFFINGKADYEFRTTLIKEYHERENILAIGEWIKGAKRYFLQKFKSGDFCMTDNLHEVDTPAAKEYAGLLKNFVPDTRLRGYDI